MFDTVEQQSGSRLVNDKLQQRIASLLSKADIQIFQGRDARARAWDMQVLDQRLFNRILGQGTLGLGEAYMDGWWECRALDEFFHRVLSADLAQHVTTWSDRWFFVAGHILNRQIGKRLRATAADHYNTGNDLYQSMLDPRMIYSCGYWQDAENLTQAQEHKLELVARKLKLKPGMKVLDIGCGWGGAAEYLATHHKVSVVGITLSEQQHTWASVKIHHPDVEIRLQDFRTLDDKFDRIYSIGMFEHVGFKNYQSYFNTVNRCLNDQGLFLLHTIGHRITSLKVDPWMNRYVFPNSILPSAEQINHSSSKLFTLEDWHNFGLDYHRTLLAWDQNCQSAWPELKDYDERFQRMWHYFLMCSAGSFKARRNHLWQIVFSKGLRQKPYQAVRSAV